MSDSARYIELEKKLSETHPQSKDFIPLWNELEEIKNRNGGNVPQETTK